LGVIESLVVGIDARELRADPPVPDGTCEPQGLTRDTSDRFVAYFSGPDH
jgi:hypothetical protein